MRLGMYGYVAIDSDRTYHMKVTEYNTILSALKSRDIGVPAGAAFPTTTRVPAISTVEPMLGLMMALAPPFSLAEATCQRRLL